MTDLERDADLLRRIPWQAVGATTARLLEDRERLLKLVTQLDTERDAWKTWCQEAEFLAYKVAQSCYGFYPWDSVAGPYEILDTVKDEIKEAQR
jgi:hypothetical protein